MINAIAILTACGFQVFLCHAMGRNMGKQCKPWAGCVWAVILAAVGYAVLMPLGVFAQASSVIGLIAGCVEAFAAAKFPDFHELPYQIFSHSGVTPEQVNNWPFRQCRKCMVTQRGDIKIAEIKCPQCGGPFRFPK